MRAVVQRVNHAKVEIDGEIAGKIETGLLIYLGVAVGDEVNNAEFIAQKVINLRIFSDDEGKMNQSIIDIGGAVLLISNFTLQADCRKGRRPGFDNAAEPIIAERLYNKTAELISKEGVHVEKGVFGAYMLVNSVNDGPGTFIIETN